MGTNKESRRTRNWATIIYPRQNEDDETTCPNNWADILQELAVKICVSPLHDKDINADGNFKKAHRHVLIAFDGVKNKEQALEIVNKIGGVGCEPISSLYSQTRYLTHIDNPEKAQYSSLDVLTFGGYEYKRYAQTKEDEEKDMISKMGKIFNIITEKQLFDFADIAEYLLQEETELFNTFRRNAYFYTQFIKSKKEFTKLIPQDDKNLL